MTTRLNLIGLFLGLHGVVLLFIIRYAFSRQNWLAKLAGHLIAGDARVRTPVEYMRMWSDFNAGSIRPRMTIVHLGAVEFAAMA